jgi:hypothetical protein
MLSHDLLRGRGKLIGGDLDVDEEGLEHNVEPLQSIHHNFVGYQFVHTRIDPLQAQSRTQARTKKKQSELSMND